MNTFYQDYKLLIWFIIISAAASALVYHWSKTAKVRIPAPLNEETDAPIIVDGDALTSDDDSLFRSVVQGLLKDMRSATSKAEIEAHYWEIEHVEDDFRNRVSPGYLNIYMRLMYDVQAEERDRILGGKMPQLAVG